MSRANAEALARGLAAYDSRDVEALLQECAEDVEWESALVKGLGGETTVYRGHDGIRDGKASGFAASSTGAMPWKPPD